MILAITILLTWFSVLSLFLWILGLRLVICFCLPFCYIPLVSCVFLSFPIHIFLFSFRFFISKLYVVLLWGIPFIFPRSKFLNHFLIVFLFDPFITICTHYVSLWWLFFILLVLTFCKKPWFSSSFKIWLVIEFVTWKISRLPFLYIFLVSCFSLIRPISVFPL